MAAAAAGLCLGTVARPAEPASSGQPGSGPSKITEALIARLPRYVAPRSTTKLPDFSPSKDTPDPAEEVLRLPKLIVRPLMKEPPSDSAWLTDKGRLELAMKNHPGLRLGNLFGLNQGVALALQQEEQLARKRVALADTIERTTLVDRAEDRKIRRMLKAVLQRPNADWLTARGGKPERP